MFFFSIKKALSLSVSSQLSRLSRFLNVLENWTRQYFITYSLRTWFILAISKQNWPLKWKNKSFYFCRLRPVDAIGSGLLSYDDICLTEECREKHLALPSATPKPLLEDSVGYLQCKPRVRGRGGGGLGSRLFHFRTVKTFTLAVNNHSSGWLNLKNIPTICRLLEVNTFPCTRSRATSNNKFASSVWNKLQENKFMLPARFEQVTIWLVIIDTSKPKRSADLLF